MIHYLDTQELLGDLLKELAFPKNAVKVLDDIGPLRIGVESLVDVFKTRRLDHGAQCIAGETNILRKYCKHRQDGACLLVGDTCQFRAEGLREGDKPKKVIWPCPECKAESIHLYSCSIGKGRAF